MNTLARSRCCPLLAAGSPSLRSRCDAQVTYDRILQRRRRAAELAHLRRHLHQPALQRAQPDHAGERRRNLEPKWVLQNQVFGAWQSNPLVVDGIMYVTQRPNDVLALDAKTGRVFWLYRYTPSPDARVCCGANNRGVAILGDTLFMGTLDAHLIAHRREDRPSRSGTSRSATSKLAYSITMAPLVVKDKVHRRRRRRRVRHPRLHRRLRREDRQGSVALLHDSRPRRAGARHVDGRRRGRTAAARSG